jgi:hypothetical protein
VVTNISIIYGDYEMNKQYCQSCGTAIAVEDAFCYQCGAKIDIIKSRTESTDSDDETHSILINTKRKRSQVSVVKRKKRKWFIRLLIIVPIILIPIITVSVITNVRIPLGTLAYSVPDDSYSSIDLSVINDVGDVLIKYDESLPNLFEASLELSGGLRASFDEAVNFEHTIIDETVQIAFDSGFQPFKFFNMKSISYFITIKLNPKIITSIAITAATGRISFYLNECPNLILEDVSLQSNTGSIGFYGENSINSTLGKVSLRTDTGHVSFKMNNAIGTCFEDVGLSTSTGSVYGHFGQNTTILDSDVDLKSSTGDVVAFYRDIFTPDDFTWDLSTSTGSIAMTTQQEVVTALNSTHSFKLDTDTGNITFNCELVSNIGVIIDASTDTGSITLPGGRSHYASEEWHSKAMLYDIHLATSTGNIIAYVTL